ncbi:MAG: TonB-dependent receptor [Steroidobacteraceae bacterium]|jgi:iron complex outermembrane receptor protein|nr:TonB-dependent receptor [Steroidobacteraceae bacterium]
MNRRTECARAVAVALGLCAAWPAFAQQGGTAPEAAGLEEIVVTAQRREENLQDVPLAVTALTAETLAQNDIRDLSRVELLTPGFSFGKSGSDARPAIRGVRTENVGVSGDPTIGFFVDNVYRSRASQANEPFVDVERVEVQRGPQGTLYGRNTFGGNVAVSAAAPTEEFAAGFDLTVGEFDRVAGSGFVNFPVHEMMQVRIAALREEMDGYVQGVDDARDIFSRDTEYARVGIRFAPTDRLEALLRYSYWSEGGTGGAAFGYRVGGAFVNPATGALSITGQPIRLNIGLPQLDGIPDVAGVDVGRPINPDPLFYPGDTVLVQDLEQHAASLNVSYDFGPVTFRSITGWVDYQVFRNADNDFTTFAGNVDAQEDSLESYSQELQLASNGGGSLDWILGYYYFREDIDFSVFSSCPSGNRGSAGCGTPIAAVPETESNAIFGQASYWLVPDRLRVTAGVRYTEDTKDVRRGAATLGANQRVVAFVPVTAVPPVLGELNLEFKKTTWRANVEYHLSEQNMLYGTVSTGFRSGGFNGGAFTNAALQGEFGPEDVTAYELGAKTRFADNRVQLNVSAYRNEFEDLQVQNQFIIPLPGGGQTTTSIILNAAKAHSQGVEVELVAVPVDNLNVAVSATLMEAEYDTYRNTPAPARYTGFVDLSGNRIPYAPESKITANVSYDFALGALGTLTPQVTALYSGDYFLTDFNTVLDRQDSFTKVDLRLGWRSASGTYSAEAFVNNVGDEVTMNRATFGSRGLNQSFDAPRMWGVRFGARF